MKLWKQWMALLLAAALLAAMTACGKREEEQPESEEEQGSRIINSLEDFSEREGEPVGSIALDVFVEIAEKKEENDDTVGWLRVPGTNIDDVVVFTDAYPDNEYYKRKGFDKNFNFNGVFYADFRCSFGDGSLSQMGANTCIYGHSMTDNKDADQYDIKFGQLHNFRDEDFARKNPYLLFSTEKESLVFEIFAVFVSNSSNPDLPYNQGDLTVEQMKSMIEKEVLPRSLYDYDVDLEDAEKFLTLSTCIYVLPDGTTISNPNDTLYRYGIMARLVEGDEPLKGEAALTVNEDPVIDPAGSMV